jgi:hypothetical protein
MFQYRVAFPQLVLMRTLGTGRLTNVTSKRRVVKKKSPVTKRGSLAFL